MHAAKTQLYQEDAFSLRTLLVSLLAIVTVVGLTILVASFFNSQRKQAIIENYTAETTTFVEANKENLAKLYTEIIPQCQADLDAQNAAQRVKNPSNFYSSSRFNCVAAKQHLDTLNVGGQLKDSSATYFISWRQPETVITIDASGEYSVDKISGDRWSSSKTYWDFFQQEKEFKPDWADFTYKLPQKEVLIPVELLLDHPGFILRGVIEK